MSEVKKDDKSELQRQVLELQAANGKMHERLRLYEQLLDSTRDLIFVKDVTSHIVYANKAMCDLYGMTQEEIAGITDAPFNQPEFTLQYLKDDAYVFETGNTLVIPEEPVTRHDGTLRLFETIKTPIRDPNGAVRLMVGIGRDITERTLAEEDRARAERALGEAEALFRKMADSMRDVFWLGLPDLSKILYVSPAYEETWGRPSLEILQDSMSFLNAIIPADLPEFVRRMEAMFAAGDGTFNHEFRVQRTDGIRWLWARTFPMYDEEGKLHRICGITHDITERKEMERRVSEFNSMVSHELRTPLTSIRAALGLIFGGQTEPIGDSTKDLLQIALAECDRMIRLINDLLDIKKIEADNLELKMGDLSPVDIVEAVMAANRMLAAKSDINLKADVTTNHTFPGDRDRVIQVLTNLVSNALKFSGTGTDVVLKVTVNGGKVRFLVADKGPGIPQSERSKLFLAFQQADSSDSRDKGGTGLGLAISKAIVDKHGGGIGFDTEVGHGSTFWFELPTVSVVRSHESAT